jgi:hypothetical protein
MSARHGHPLREYLTRADFLRKDLRSPDPAVARAAAERCSVLERLAPAVRAGTLAQCATRQDVLDVVASEAGFRDGWRAMAERLYFLFPSGSPEFRRGYEIAHQREEKRLHDELLGYALDRTSIAHWSGVCVDLDDWRSEDLPRPRPIASGETEYLPDLTGMCDGVFHIVEVKRDGAFRYPKTVAQLKAFSDYARAVGARLELFVDGWGAEVAPAYIRKHGIHAEIVVWEGQYRHEIEDAMAADWWRDVDD